MSDLSDLSDLSDKMLRRFRCSMFLLCQNSDFMI